MHRWNDNPCINCGSKIGNATYSELCNTCYIYRYRNGTDRPPKPPRWCIVCGGLHIKAKGMCDSCYMYQWEFHRVRPRHLWDDDLKCKNCKKPLSLDRRPTKGKCYNCYMYSHKFGKERPPRIWGVTSFGWCECGQPAVNIVKGMALCGGCEALEKSVY